MSYEMTKITNSNQSHKSYREYKSENGRTRTSEWDLVPWRSKHPLLTGHTHRELLVEIKYTGLPVIKGSMETTVKKKKGYETSHSWPKEFVMAIKVL
jgi:hypothetical protein